jgi:membrane protein DedA with SNARE-associated domain
MHVGVITDPGLSTKLAEPLITTLPATLAREVSDSVGWKLSLCSYALPLEDDGTIDISGHSAALKSRHGWDLVVCVTELTRRLDRTLMVCDADISAGAALISLPALGPIRLRHHVGRMIVHVVRDLTAQALPTGSPANMKTPLTAGSHTRREVTDGPDRTNALTALTPMRGRLRLLLGMVRVNRPWRLLPSLSSAIAAGVAAAAFGIFYSSIWNMADSMSTTRLAAVSVGAVLAMMVWLMSYNRLWERPRDLDQRRNAVLYNSATVLTLAVGIGFMYVVLFGLVFIGAVTIIPPPYLEATLRHAVTWRDYAELAWLSSSLGTFAGALGSSFESDYAVRNATYGKREQERHARATAAS